eukprot:scaffold6016_cov119-Isochrysis_galbana.AAC.9
MVCAVRSGGGRAQMVLRRATRQEQTPDVGCEAGRGWGGYLAGGAARGSYTLIGWGLLAVYLTRAPAPALGLGAAGAPGAQAAPRATAIHINSMSAAVRGLL